MARSSQRRRTCPDHLILRIEQAFEAKIYLLRETGPTGFLLKEDEADRYYKVLLGDPHTCTCPTFKKERELCIHILWVILRKFRVPKETEVVYQLGLVEREINEVVFGALMKKEKKRVIAAKQDGKKKSLQRKAIEEEDICPICHVELSGSNKREDLTYCRFGCGNNIHLSCMKVWAEHQNSSGDGLIKCPLCRSDFGPFKALIQEYFNSKSKSSKAKENNIHTGTKCRHCGSNPIQGKCYRCESCQDFYLCSNCFASNWHDYHTFQVLTRTNSRWKPANRDKASHPNLELSNSFPFNRRLSETHSNINPARESLDVRSNAAAREHLARSKFGGTRVGRSFSGSSTEHNGIETDPTFGITGCKLDRSSSRTPPEMSAGSNESPMPRNSKLIGSNRSSSISRPGQPLPRSLPPLPHVATRTQRTPGRDESCPPTLENQPLTPFQTPLGEIYRHRTICPSADSVMARRHKVRPIPSRKNLSADVLRRKTSSEPYLRDLEDVFQVSPVRCDQYSS